MGRRDRWQKNSNGPDWTDIGMTLRELEKLHSCWISLRLLSAGSFASNALRIVCTAYTNELVRPGEPGLVMIQGMWPNKDNATLEGACYALLLDLDFRCSQQMWIQTELL